MTGQSDGRVTRRSAVLAAVALTVLSSVLVIGTLLGHSWHFTRMTDSVINTVDTIGEVAVNFKDMNLREHLLRGISAYGLRPSSIQQRIILPMMEGRDVIVESSSVTGKTAAFSISALQQLEQLDMNIPNCQALILSPTRERGQQIQKLVLALGDYMKVKCHACLGDTSVSSDLQVLQDGVHVVVGTPARVFHMISRGALKTDATNLLVIDEADEILSGGMKDDTEKVFRRLPTNIQVALFSATMPEAVLQVTKQFMHDPLRIFIQKEEFTFEGIRQFYINVEKEEWKLETLMDLYQTITINKAVVFMDTSGKVDWLNAKLHEQGFTPASMHVNMPQSERDAIAEDFHSKSSGMLITHDLVARGLDMQKISTVISYDLPHDPDLYLWRIGGRVGDTGVAINFMTQEEVGVREDIENFYDISIEEMPMNIADLI